MTHQIAFAARSDRGLIRASNQDSVYAGNNMLVVADGMGGHAAGDMASRLVVAAFVPLDSREGGGDLLRALAKATRDGNGAIAQVVHENPELDGMGTTLTALLFDGGRLGMAHVGDSRAYLYRDGVLHQLTHDDTFVQSLIDDGRITQEEAAHHPQRSLLLRALNGTDVDPSLTIREVTAGDRYLICSDGLPGVVSAEAIAEALADPDPGATADALIQLALVGGGPDNITVIVADVMDTGIGNGPIEAAADVDPDATGPIGSIESVRMTAEMPRVPLPGIPEDVPARPEFVPADPPLGPGGDDDLSGPPRGRRNRWGTWALAVGVVLIVAGLVGSFLWVRSQFYVGEANGEVVVYRGVDGAVLGLQLSSVQEGSCEPGLNGCSPLLIVDLVPAARNQVVAGIRAGTLDDARGVIARLAGEMLPLCPTADTSPTSAAPTGVSTPPGTGASGSAQSSSSAAGAGLVPLPPTSPGASPTAAPSTATLPTPDGSALSPGAAGAPIVPSGAVTGSATGSDVPTTASTSPSATGTPLPTRTQEPGVTCRVAR